MVTLKNYLHSILNYCPSKANALPEPQICIHTKQTLFIWKDFAWSITINNFIICNRNSAITILIRTWLKKSMLNKASVTFGEGNNGFEVPGKSQFSKCIWVKWTWLRHPQCLLTWPTPAHMPFHRSKHY